MLEIYPLLSVAHDDPFVAHPSVPSSECPDKPVTPKSQNVPLTSGRISRKPSLKDYEPQVFVFVNNL